MTLPSERGSSNGDILSEALRWIVQRHTAATMQLPECGGWPDAKQQSSGRRHRRRTLFRVTSRDILAVVEHRPWPLPSGPWIMFQSWLDLAFLHWPVAHDVLRPLVPSPLPLDTFDGQCWVGLVPFHMANLRARGLPRLPGLSRTAEINVRTYVTVGGKPGVYFFSLDIGLLSAVFAARSFYRLPYFYAAFQLKIAGEEVSRYECRRRVPANAEFIGGYAPVDLVQHPPPGTLEHWLTERYCLYTATRSSAFRAEIHHPRWPLQDGEARIERNTMADAAGIRLPETAPLVHYSKRQDVLVWPLRRIR